jgi:hypothetical protein
MLVSVPALVRNPPKSWRIMPLLLRVPLLALVIVPLKLSMLAPRALVNMPAFVIVPPLPSRLVMYPVLVNVAPDALVIVLAPWLLIRLLLVSVPKLASVLV